MRKLVTLLIAIAFAIPANAQFQAESSRKVERAPIGVGIKVGATLHEYRYDAKDLNTLGRNSIGMDTLWQKRVRLSAGVQVEIPMSENFLFTPELIYTSKGDRRVYRNKPSGSTLTYEAKVNYLDLRLPLTYVVPMKGKLKPYVFAGLDAAMVLPYIKMDSVEINLSGTLSQGTEIEVNKSNMAPFDVSAFGGLGLRFTFDFNRFLLVMKLEADYNFGLLNTYSKDEIASQVPAANLGVGGTHYILGSRKNQGLEAFLTVVLPLKFYRDACSFGTSRVNKGKKGQLYGF
ncbi:MAG: PorT family protein [Bacteroidales bacterium]|nr:PorT family protein [Bacteroidales bacterium]